MNATLTLTFLTELDGERDRQDFLLPAAFTPVLGGFVVSYTEEIDEHPTAVTVTAVGNTVKIDRRGDSTVSFLLEPGTPHPCAYQTPYGTIAMQVKNVRIENRLTLNGGTLSADYTLDMGGGSSLHTMTMNIRMDKQ